MFAESAKAGSVTETFTVYCDAPMCKRNYTFYEKALADSHYKRCHEDRKHWAYIK